MKIEKRLGWIFYLADTVSLDSSKIGKWMLFFNFDNQKEFFENICRDVVSKGILQEAKCSSVPNAQGQGVAIFYLNIDDMDTHKKIISYFIENDLIQKTKTGKLYNMSFKLDEQTRNGEYKDNFKAQLKLEEILDLNTREFLI